MQLSRGDVHTIHAADTLEVVPKLPILAIPASGESRIPRVGCFLPRWATLVADQHSIDVFAELP